MYTGFRAVLGYILENDTDAPKVCEQLTARGDMLRRREIPSVSQLLTEALPGMEFDEKKYSKNLP